MFAPRAHVGTNELQRRGLAERLPRNARNTNKLNGLKYVRASRVPIFCPEVEPCGGLLIEGGHQTRLSRVDEGQQPIINGCKDSGSLQNNTARTRGKDDLHLVVP